MTRALSLIALAGTLLAFQDAAEAQGVSVDLRAVGATATQRLAGADLSVGVGFGATVAYHVQQHLAAYGGWDWIHFQAQQSFAGTDMAFDETGYTLGLRFEHPMAGDDVMFRVEAGGTYKHIEIANVDGDIVDDSGHELGLEAGGGVVVPLGTNWRLTPTVRFRTLTPQFEIAGLTTKADMRYAGVEIGVSRRF
jgi:hypothetical protein